MANPSKHSGQALWRTPLETVWNAERFDQVVLACHSDQALAMLEDPSPSEQEVLGAIPYRENNAVLHTDTRILPRRRSIWSSWNYLIPREETGRAVLTYDMNILQTIKAPVEFCVTLNRESAIAPDRVIGKYRYHHPIYLGTRRRSSSGTPRSAAGTGPITAAPTGHHLRAVARPDLRVRRCQ